MADGPFNLEQMRLVTLIEERRSFSRVALDLGITQSAVSQQVRTIERALGRSLFRRGATGLGTTEDGEAYLVYARAMLAIGEDAKRHFSGPGSAAEIRLGLTEDFARTALPAVLALFSRDYPQFGFIVETGLSTTLFAGLDEGRYDVVVAKRLGHARDEHRLWSEPLAWYGRDDTTIPLSDPIHLALIPAPSVSREAILAALGRSGRRWRITFQCMSFGAIEAVVMAGVGITAFGQHFSAPGLVELGSESGLPPLGHVDICLERSPHRSSEAIDAFCALLRQMALLTTGQDAESQIDLGAGRSDQA